MPESKLDNIHCVNVVWGNQFVSTFLNYSLPLQLSPGNAGALKGIGRYRIFTTSEDRITIERSPAYRRLNDFVDVEFVPISIDENRHKIYQMTDCHCEAVRHAAKERAALIFLCADSLVSDSSFDRILQSTKVGKRVTLVCSPRVLMEEYCPLYDKLSPEKGGVSPRDLVKLSLKCLHPISKSLFWGNPKINSAPSHIYWQLDENNLLARGYHIHPLFIWPENYNELPTISIDYEYIMRACPNRDSWEIIEDSDEMAVFEVSAKSLESQIRYMKSKFYLMRAWASKFALPLHRYFATKRVLIHSDDVKPSWVPIFERSDLIIKKVSNEAKGTLLISKFIWFLSRLPRAHKKLYRILSQYLNRSDGKAR